MQLQLTVVPAKAEDTEANIRERYKDTSFETSFGILTQKNQATS